MTTEEYDELMDSLMQLGADNIDVVKMPAAEQPDAL